MAWRGVLICVVLEQCFGIAWVVYMHGYFDHMHGFRLVSAQENT